MRRGDQKRLGMDAGSNITSMGEEEEEEEDACWLLLAEYDDTEAMRAE